MKLTKKRRNFLIEELIERDIDTVQQAALHEDFEYLDALLREGFKGYVNWSDEDLVYEYEDWTGVVFK